MGPVMVYGSAISVAIAEIGDDWESVKAHAVRRMLSAVYNVPLKQVESDVYEPWWFEQTMRKYHAQR